MTASLLRPLSLVLCLLGQASVACSGPAEWPRGDDEPDPELSPEGEVPASVEIIGTVVEPGPHPVEGLTVCLFGKRTGCETTDLQGRFSMRVPSRTKLMFSFEGRDEFPAAVATYETGTNDGSFRVLTFPVALESLLEGAIGQTLDWSLGQILMQARSDRADAASNVAGVSAQISPASGVGPFYQDDVLPDVTLSATGAAGAIGFVNLEAGSYQVELHHPARTCSPWAAWPGDDPSSVTVEVVEGYVTLATVVCE